jgi:hypothetical protein
MQINLNIQEEYKKHTSLENNLYETIFPAAFGMKTYFDLEIYNDHWYVVESVDNEFGKYIVPLDKHFDWEVTRKDDRTMIMFPEAWKEYYEKILHKKANILYDKSSYVHETKNLAEFPGPEFARCRENCSRIIRQNNPTYKNITAKTITEKDKLDMFNILYDWEKGYYKYIDMFEETDFDDDVLQIINWEKLELIGQIYYIEEKPIGFTYGFEMNKNVFNGYSMKFDHSFRMHQFMQREFAKWLLSLGYQKMNIGEAGTSGLAENKSQYPKSTLEHRYFIYL